ncbi:girdin isoform X1 [Bactrocera dorsalis]|uniref:Girdin isoform X1 n=1 Tax=Bactrocera dorsalis TaxID=27457 RepID=A0A6I9W241_BACDO|nr:girdin isoform X1 [Bactrocera dorsalis]
MANAGTATPLEIDEFINGALVTWLESCLPRPEVLTGYSSLLDGNIIHSVWLQIDPEPQNHPTDVRDLIGVSLCIARSKNFECIARNLKSLFEEELEHTILVLPDVYILGYHPESKQGLEQMKILLTLLLGAAVQCPNREAFIGRIKMLDVETQHAIVGLIKQVTEDQSLVLTKESVNLLTPVNMYNHILRLTKERDNMYLRWIASMCADTELNMTACADGSLNMPLSPLSCTLTTPCLSTSNSENNHMAVELADLKSKIRKLRQELEEKSENQLELREELDHKSAQYEKLRAESQEWYAEAKRAYAYRDEVDVLRERAERADRLEIEVQKFREKLTDAEFYKTRVEELREDNRMLLETKEMLEDQLQRARKRSEHVMTLESEIIKYKQKLNDMALERNVDRSKLEELLEENTQLQLAAKTLNTTQRLDSAYSDNEDECNSGDNSLSEQLTNDAQTRILKLELKNKQLAAALEQLKENSFHESTNKILELEKDKKKLSLKIEQMQENIQRLTQQNTALEEVFKSALEENKKLQDTMDDRQKSYERQSQERELERSKLLDVEQHVETLNKEKQRLQTLNESIQRRADDLDRLLDTRTKEIHQLTERSQGVSKLKEKVYDLEAKLCACERENNSLLKEVAKLKENTEGKSVQLDESTAKLEAQTKEIDRLTKELTKVEQTQQRVIELEKLNQELMTQREIDSDTILTLRNDLVSGTLATNKVRQNLEKLGLTDSGHTDDNGELNVETVVEKLVRNPETFKTVREIMLNVSKEQHQNENTKSDICVLCHRKEIYTVEKNIELSNNEPQELSFEHKVTLTAPTGRDRIEILRLKEANTELSALNTNLQSVNVQLEAEKARLDVDVVTLSSQISTLNTQLVALQVANSQLASDKDQLLKQSESIKQENKNVQHDLMALRTLHDQLSTEYESLAADKEQLKLMQRDSRNEARELREHISNLENRIADLTKDNAKLKSYENDLTILRTEHSKLTDDFRNLFRFKNEYKNIQEQYKMIRPENNKLKKQIAELLRELDSKNDHIKTMESDAAYYAQQCEVLLQTNAHLDIDRKTLMDNVSQLLTQYHELLSHSLEDKQHFREEEKSYTERLHNLSRQKEKLEEKIMEHYKKPETVLPKKKPFASSIVRRVKKAGSDFINKVPTSRNRRSWVDDSRLNQSQFVVGSESGGNDSDNSIEEPMSIESDSHLLQRNLAIRQSLQRDLIDSTLSRGGIRSSLQSQKRTDLNSSRRNSVHGLEAPDVTGSSLTLGTAGSRRTVYLIDEHQKIPETNSTCSEVGDSGEMSNSHCALNSSACSTSTTLTGAGTLGDAYMSADMGVGGTGVGIAEPQTPSNLSSVPNNDNPTTFLMYNRINTTIGNTNSECNMPPGTSRDSTITSNNSTPVTSTNATQDDKSLRKRTDDKSNSIWYEYGCV